MMLSEPLTELEGIEASAPRRGRILVVDDDPAQLAPLEHRLAKLGYQVLTACAGREALRQASSGRPDLILLDVCLPDVEGFQVCEALADDPLTCATPVILLSGLDRDDLVRRSRAAGGQYFVRKPYDPNVLLLLIEHALGNA